jgi:23S rRNA (cytidine1920-2'-O)/16S rRNA (cytidine1409-2'-O)-methyltransferase
VAATLVTRRRLDSELVRRGLVSSRTEAQEAVRAGLVRVGGSPATKVATLVSPDAPLVLVGPPRRFVSRGGEKLGAALDRFGIDPTGLECLDAGASTGGFTDRLLQGGAAHVVAVDVGYGQLAWELRADTRVTVLERTNVRDLRAESLSARPELLVADLSFISLRSVLPAIVGLLAPGATTILLVKPQFEAGRDDVGRGGVVSDPAVWERVLRQVLSSAGALDLVPQGVMASPVVGPAGNVEFLVWAVRGGRAVELDVEAAVAEGLEARS